MTQTDTDRETIIMRLADLADVLRDARRAGQAAPHVCGLEHDARHQWTLGTMRFCLKCGREVLPADVLHRRLTVLLREGRSRRRRYTPVTAAAGVAA